METEKQEKVDKLKLASTYGLIFGGIICLIEFFRLSGAQNSFLGLLSNLVTFGALIYFMIQYREKLGGYIKYKEVVSFGILVFIFSYILFGFFMYIYTTFIEPNYITTQFNLTLENLNLSHLVNDEAFKQATVLANNPVVIIISYTLAGTIVGTILSLIFGLFVKKEKQ